MARRMAGGKEDTAEWLEINGEGKGEGERGGKVRFIELDAEVMGSYFGVEDEGRGRGGQAEQEAVEKQEKVNFDAVWISEALSHFPDKTGFFQNAFAVLRVGGRLVLADWFKDEGLDEKIMESDIKPIERK